jgi:small subunit ribosomal protein S9
MPRQKSKLSYFEAVGRRKSAVCRVRVHLVSGKELSLDGKAYTKGAIMVNDIDAKTYFQGAASKEGYIVPLALTDSMERFVVTAYVNGGGKRGQLVAFTLALSRALEKADDTTRAKLKPAGLLSVDARVRQRRMAGMAGKSRKKRQSPKR